MTSFSKTSLAAAAVLTPMLALGAKPAHGQDDAFTSMMTGGEPSFRSRLRYEQVDDGNSATDDAQALTLATRLGYETAVWEGFSAFGEFEDVRVVAGQDDYAPEQAGYATVADPEATELNQSYVQFQQGPFSARYGRQRIILGNARFVGNVGWRQNEQTYDAFRADYDNDTFAVTGAWLTYRRGIIPALDQDTEHGLVNASWKEAPGGPLTAYGYMLENPNTEATRDTFGARYDGSFDLDSLKLLLWLEYAGQETDNGSGTTADMDYTRAELGVDFNGVTAKVGQEVLGSDDGNRAFQTPLATLHAFNGWADQFLGTPAGGLEDSFVSVGGKLAGTTLKVVHHQFAADASSTEYGSETDLLAKRSFGDHYSAGIKYADYSTDASSATAGVSHTRDTQKFWLWGTMKF
jgi:hypothetical protein